MNAKRVSVGAFVERHPAKGMKVSGVVIIPHLTFNLGCSESKKMAFQLGWRLFLFVRIADSVLSINVLSPILRVDTHATLVAFPGGTIDGFL